MATRNGADAQLTRRILRAWRASSADELAAGIAWYDRAQDTARALSAGTSLSERQTAAVIAALSPRCAWSANVRGAASMVDAASRGQGEPVVAGTLTNRRKAWAIAQGADPDAVLSGPKVRSFFANITGDACAVTVDVWAARAAEGRDDPNAPKGSRYQRIADAYRRAAEIAGVTPREVQAAVWCHVRGKVD